jgi:large subunit ribosomal protein L3
MALRMGLLGKKVGMTQTFDDKGNWSALTVVEVGPCVVLDKKTEQRDGYSALLLGFDDKPANRTTKPRAGLFHKVGTEPKRFVREIRLPKEDLEQFEVGQALTADQVFGAGDVIDVTGTSRGKGFQGVIKRYHFRGFRATHGTHEYFRHGGSIGCRLTPGRVAKGKKMPGQMGNRRVTVQNLRVSEVLGDKNLVLVAGAVPGSPDGYLTLRHGAKRPGVPFRLKQATEPAAASAES